MSNANGPRQYNDRRGLNPSVGGGNGVKPQVRTGGFGEVSSSDAKKNAINASKMAANAETNRDPRTAKLSEILHQYSQNVTVMHRLVQMLGGAKDTSEIRGNFENQRILVEGIGLQAEKELAKVNSQLESEEISRQELTRLRAVQAKLTKDYNRVNGLAKDMNAEATRRMNDIDKQRKELAISETANFAQAFGSENKEISDGGSKTLQQQQLKAQLAEEAINQEIIQETEVELGNINRTLHTVHNIFQELASLVSQQQEQVNHIENQTESAHHQAQQGLAQIQQANHYSNPNCTIS